MPFGTVEQKIPVPLSANGEQKSGFISGICFVFFLQSCTIGIDNPKIEIYGDIASITYTSVLNANACGAREIYRISGTHWFEKQNGDWITINNPNK